MKYGTPVYRCKLVKTGQKLYGQINNPYDVVKILKEYWKGKDREEFVVFFLDAGHQVIGFTSITTGLVDKTHVHPREVFKPAILAGAAAIVVAHNHPSLGNLRPSQEDRDVTRQLKQVGSEIVGIPLLDHVIVANNVGSYLSFSEEGIL